MLRPLTSLPIWMALRLLLLSGLLALSGCGKSLSELLNDSQIYSVTVAPNPVPAPTVGGGVAFTLTIRFDSNNSDDDLLIYVSDPNDGGRFKFIGLVDACPGIGDNCGITTLTVECYSRVFVGARPDRRFVSCAGNSGVELPPGTHTLRVEIKPCSRVLGCDNKPDDTFETPLTVQ